MSEIKILTREQFEVAVKNSETSRRAYESLGNFGKQRWGIFQDNVAFSHEDKDYIFCKTENSDLFTCIGKLWERYPACRYPIQLPCNTDLEGSPEKGAVFVGLKFWNNPENIEAVIGCTVSNKSLEEEAEHSHYSDTFWPWDEISIEKDRKRTKAEIWLHGESPSELSHYISRGILDSAYQSVLRKFKIPQGKINVRYSGGSRPVPVLYPGFGRAPWIGS